MCNKEKCTHVCECGHLLVAHSETHGACFYSFQETHKMCPCKKFKLVVIKGNYHLEHEAD